MFGYETTKPGAGNEKYIWVQNDQPRVRNNHTLGTKRQHIWVRNVQGTPTLICFIVLI